MIARVTEATPVLAAASGNRIPATQNDDESLKLLAARSDRYARAFAVFSAQFVLAVAVPVILSLLQSFVSSTHSWAAAYGAAMVLLIEPWLDRSQQRFKEQAARVQERFDRRLFELSWPQTSLGQAPSPADISVWARNALRRVSERERARWKDWYPVIVGGVPRPVACVLCQNANAWWDARQRERTANVLRFGGLLLGGLLVAVALASDLRLSVFLEQFVTVAPLVSWCLREAERHERTVRGRERVMEQAGRLVEAAVTRSISEQTLVSAASELQRDIYEQRREGPLVLPFIYSFMREEQETGMRDSAEDAVRRYCSEAAPGAAV